MAKAVTLAAVGFGTKRSTQGRYGTGVRGQAPNVETRTAVATVDDLSRPGFVQRATVNYTVDLLEQERALGRISEAAYRTGRIVQAVFEKHRELQTSFRGEFRESTGGAPDANMMRHLRTSRRIAEIEVDIDRAIGSYGRRLVRQLMVENSGFAEAAAKTGKGGERGAAYIAHRFRSHLEEMAEEFGAVGGEGRSIRGARDGVEVQERRRQAKALNAGKSCVTQDIGKQALDMLASDADVDAKTILRSLLLVA